MEPADKIQKQEKKIKNPGLEHSDLQQSLMYVADFYHEIRLDRV
jgi:hypothetical protein